ncbi:ATP-grasp domain-containing protein [Streptomyces sp. NPDC001941]|uniref:ATP-grasp domain-containing protein n=1 Tax=Streptomyces sp. NPDC001941 TaxID=3154659 RepID=UPI0033309E0B
MTPVPGATLLTCGDPLRPGRPDPHFAGAARAAGELGAGVALVDHDALVAGRADEAVARVERGTGPLWYRGWMLPAERYAQLARALAGRGRTLVTDAAQYRTAHELPGWYGTLAEATPASVWLPTEPGVVPPVERLAELAARLPPGAVVVKDYVKSRKHEWDEACFVPDAADHARLSRVVGRFVELQEEFLAGGIVLRAFEDFTGEERRVWWVDGEPVLTTAHPDADATTAPDPGGRPLPAPDLARVAPLVRALGCPFVTTDMALRTDGAWRVVEVGDGQVSGLPADVEEARLLEHLLGDRG